MGAVSALGGLLPVISGITTGLQLFNGDLGLFNDLTGRNDREAAKQMRELQKNNYNQALQTAAMQQQQRNAETAIAEEKRRDALRRAVARQRASFGSQGIGSAGGSSEAVLLGLFEESDEQRAERERLDSLRTQASGLDLAQQNSTNLLLATQLAERQKLQRFYLGT